MLIISNEMEWDGNNASSQSHFISFYLRQTYTNNKLISFNQYFLYTNFQLLESIH